MNYNVLLLLAAETLLFIFFTRYTFKCIYDISYYFEYYLSPLIINSIVFLINYTVGILILIFLSESIIYGIYYIILNSVIIFLYLY